MVIWTEKKTVILRFPRVGDTESEIDRLRELSDHFFNCVFKEKADPFTRPWIGINFPNKQMGCLDCANLFNINPAKFGTKNDTDAHIMSKRLS